MKPEKTIKKGTNAQAVIRQQAALEYRLGGFSYRDIGAQLGVSGKTAYYDVQNSIAEIEAVKSERAEQLIVIEQLKLDRMEALLNKAANTGDVKAILAKVRIQERRAKLLGLDAAIQVKQEVSGLDGKPFVFTMKFNSDND
jgi:hypothetical protein